jgi:hypothetical protein
LNIPEGVVGGVVGARFHAGEETLSHLLRQKLSSQHHYL